jgi:ADP-L-glycero-D-manno-heptose 6-epimerase
MKILVTGSEGFIGQNFTRNFRGLGYEVTTFDIKNNPKARPIDLNISGYDWVIHLGAISSTTETDVNKIMDLNLLWSIELLEHCKEHKVNMQWASSASVYGNNKLRNPFKETDPCNPLNYYAKSKYLFEQYVNTCDLNINVQGFRYFNVYGPYEEHKGKQASPYTQFAKQAKESGAIKVFEGSEKYKRDFVHVDTLFEVQHKMLNRDVSGIFNLGSGSTRSFLDVARDVALLYDAEIETIPFPRELKSHYQTYTCADMNLIYSYL